MAPPAAQTFVRDARDGRIQSPPVLYGVATQLGVYGLQPTLETAAAGDSWQLVAAPHVWIRSPPSG